MESIRSLGGRAEKETFSGGVIGSVFIADSSKSLIGMC